MSSLNSFLRKSQKPEIYPLIGILTCALTGAVYAGYHAAKAPDVAWNHKSNPYPWQEIQDGEQVKFMALNQKYDGRWDRSKCSFLLVTMLRLPTLVKVSKPIGCFASQWRQLSTFIETEKPLRSRRALFYVPASDERKIHKSISVNADCIAYDLEDSVSSNKKGAARHMVIDALEASEHGKAEKAVRINAVGSGHELDDLNVILHSKRLQSIIIPKVSSAKDIQFVSRMIDSVAVESQRERIRLIASVESALGFMNMKEIATADPRLDALIFAAEDYCADLGLTRTSTRKEMLFARQYLVNAAVAYGLQAIDLVCMDFQDKSILLNECKEGREFGFTGKQAIHPDQIETIHKMFLPDPKELERALRIVEGHDHYSQKGIGAFNLDGKAIDMPVVKWAEKVIARAKAGNMPIPKLEPKKDTEKITEKK